MRQSLVSVLSAAVLLFCGCGSSDHSSQQIVVTISPNTATVLARGSHQFAAMVSGSSNNSVSWSVREGSAGGIVSDTGLYTAPLTPGNYTVVATSLADSSRTGSATVSVTLYSGVFKPAGALLTSHTFHSSTLTRDGKIFIAGDIDVLNDGKVTETYDVAAGTSLRGPDLLLARYSHAGVLLPTGQVLILAGYIGGTAGVTDSTDVYDPSSGTITSGPRLPQASAFQSIAELPDGRIVVAGGRSTNNFGTIDAVSVYNPGAGSFDSAGVLAYPISQSTSTVLADGRLLFAGGSDPTFSHYRYFSASQTYDPSLRQSVLSGDMSFCRIYHTATLLANGTVLVTGGVTFSSSTFPCSASFQAPSATMEIYDPVGGTFTRTSDMTTPRANHTATLLPNGKVLIIGGDNPTAEVYDPETGISTPTATMSAPRGGHTATLLPDGRVVIIGGGPTTVEVFQ